MHCLSIDGWLLYGIIKAAWLILWLATNFIYFIVGVVIEEELRHNHRHHKYFEGTGLYLLFVAITLCFSEIPIFGEMTDIFVFEATAVCFLGALIAVCALPIISLIIAIATLLIGYDYFTIKPKNDLELFVKEIPERLGGVHNKRKQTTPIHPENDRLARRARLQ